MHERFFDSIRRPRLKRKKDIRWIILYEAILYGNHTEVPIVSLLFQIDRDDIIYVSVRAKYRE